MKGVMNVVLDEAKDTNEMLILLRKVKEILVVTITGEALAVVGERDGVEALNAAKNTDGVMLQAANTTVLLMRRDVDGERSE